ncbi:hypothetical protein KVR01_000858 [Diaporthe batatas]|uniref:uncharacterized protein n=1 Tax=Diaporthe batatas TaxID=748121 RepID=UPI001D048D9B|nr:uncharacterized protein KVR01_000858 [Diaporthe batatas]KAG8170113.1 hypothetical protein KVR01_000858 [Diaporthe batatas]
MHRLSFLILLLGAFASLAVAATAPTFCKCTCFTNSTIIEIKPKSSSKPPAAQPQRLGTTPPSPDDHPDALSLSSSSSSDLDEILAAPAADEESQDSTGTTTSKNQPHPLQRRARRAQAGSSSGSCSQCNRSFCLSQSLPICRGAADKDVSTMCFQRDSRKDQVIVWGFILGTAGLLGWAAVHKVFDMRSGGGSLPGVGGGAGAGAGRRGSAAGGSGGGGAGGILPLGRGGLGSTGTDGGRGAYAAVAGHSRESSLRTN